MRVYAAETKKKIIFILMNIKERKTGRYTGSMTGTKTEKKRGRRLREVDIKESRKEDGRMTVGKKQKKLQKV